MKQEVFQLYDTTDIQLLGLLRNEKEFEIGQRVYFHASRFADENFFWGVIVGKELDGAGKENPEWQYKIRIPKDSAGRIDDKMATGVGCESIFFSEEEAKESARKMAKRMYDINLERIEECFCKRTIA